MAKKIDRRTALKVLGAGVLGVAGLTGFLTKRSDIISFLDADKDNEEAAILMMNVVYLLGDLNEAPKALYRALNCNGGEILTRN